MARYTPLELAEAFIRTSELADALDALNPHLDANPHDETALRLRAAVLMRLPGEDHARAALADLRQLTTKTADDFVQESVIWQMGLGNWEQAVSVMEQAHQIASGDDRISERLLMLYDHVGEVHKARALLNSLPRTWRWRQLAGDLERKAHETENAIGCYDEALELLEQKMDTLLNPIVRNIMGMIVGSRAEAHLEAGHLIEAERDFRTTADVFPTDLSYGLSVGITLALQHKLDEAVSLCQSILKDEPSLAANLQNTARIQPLLDRLGL
jgi:Flp pilus assembly protein TadD